MSSRCRVFNTTNKNIPAITFGFNDIACILYHSSVLIPANTIESSPEFLLYGPGSGGQGLKVGIIHYFSSKVVVYSVYVVGERCYIKLTASPAHDFGLRVQFGQYIGLFQQRVDQSLVSWFYNESSVLRLSVDVYDNLLTFFGGHTPFVFQNGQNDKVLTCAGYSNSIYYPASPQMHSDRGHTTWSINVHNNEYFVTFKGTDTFRDVLKTIGVEPAVWHGSTVIKVHSGYLTSVTNIFDRIIQKLLEANTNITLTVTGHSMGGGLAQLFALELRYRQQNNLLPMTITLVDVITFAAPMTLWCEDDDLNSPEFIAMKDSNAGLFRNFMMEDDFVPLLPAVLAAESYKVACFVLGWTVNFFSMHYIRDSVFNIADELYLSKYIPMGDTIIMNRNQTSKQVSSSVLKSACECLMKFTDISEEIEQHSIKKTMEEIQKRL